MDSLRSVLSICVTVSVACVWRQVWRIRHIDITDVRSYLRSRLARNYRHPGFITAIEPITAPRWLPASSHYAQSSVGVALYIKLYRRYAPVYTAHPFSHIHTSSSVKAGSAHETRES